MSTELGHHAKRVYLSQDGALVVPSSARVVIEPGGILSQYSGGLSVSLGTVTTTTGAGISPRGLTVIKTTVNTVHGIKALTKWDIGVRKTIIFDTTSKVTLRASTISGSNVCKFGSSMSCVKPASDLGKMFHKTYQMGNVIELIAASTNRWYVVNLGSSAGRGAGWVFSSST